MPSLCQTDKPLQSQTQRPCRFQLNAVKHHVVDNKCSQELNNTFLKCSINFQLFHLAEHCAKAAKCAIHKPLHCHPQQSWFNEIACFRMKFSHWTCIDHHGYTHPCQHMLPYLAIMTTIVCHIFPQEQRLLPTPWQKPMPPLLSVVAWAGTLPPSPDSYCCHNLYFPDTMAKCNVLKVYFPPQKTPFPDVLATEFLKQTAAYVTHTEKPQAC